MKKYFGKGFAALMALVGVGLTASNSFAVLSADQLAATGEITTMITDLAAWGWTAIILLIGFTIGVKLFKKIMGKAT